MTWLSQDWKYTFLHLLPLLSSIRFAACCPPAPFCDSHSTTAREKSSTLWPSGLASRTMCVYMMCICACIRRACFWYLCSPCMQNKTAVLFVLTYRGWWADRFDRTTAGQSLRLWVSNVTILQTHAVVLYTVINIISIVICYYWHLL